MEHQLDAACIKQNKAVFELGQRILLARLERQPIGCHFSRDRNDGDAFPVKPFCKLGEAIP